MILKRLSKSSGVYPLITVVCLLLIWQTVVYFGGWSIEVLPGPVVVWHSFVELLLNGVLLRDIVASLYRVTIGFYIAAMLAIPLGIFLGRWKVAKSLINPLIQFLRPISPLAWIPLAMLWFGIGDVPAIFLIFLASFFSLVVSTTIAVEGISEMYFQVAANFNFTRYEVIRKVVLPAILPEVVTALRITVAIAWLIVVAAEMIAVQSGLGYLILDSRNALRMDYVFVGMIIIGIIGLGLDTIMQRMAAHEYVIWKKVHS